MGRGDKDSDSEGDDRRRRRKRERDRKRKRHHYSSDESSSEDRRSKKKKHKKKDKKKKSSKKSSKKEKRKEHKRSRKEEHSDAVRMQELERNYVLSEALHELLLEHPTAAMAKDTLPLVLLKLGGGTSLDLSQMPDKRASLAIQRVLKALESFGVGEEEPQVWKWTVPGGGKVDERFLLKIVRTMLNEVGFNMEAIKGIEKKAEEDSKKPATITHKDGEVEEQSEFDRVQQDTVQMLQLFQGKNKEQSTSTLPGELGGLCNMLLEGESVALDGLPDKELKKELENLFEKCGLQLQEMEGDSDDEDDNNDKTDGKQPAMGYALPDSPHQEKVSQAKLLSVLKACENVASAPPVAPAARVKGPMPMPAGYEAPEESSDEEGPAPVGVSGRQEPPRVSKELIKHQAEMRARQLRGAVSGNPELMSSEPNTREEWMLDPGKFDFLSSIKAGNPMKSRTFKAKAKSSEEEASQAMDPKIKAQVDAIMQAHNEARGPTLVEQHRMKKQKEKEESAKSGKKGEWKWNREKDLDSGRRVDKNALHQVLGGAQDDLKKKFQGGY